MFFWVQWNVCWHSVGDSLLCSFFIVWSHCRSFSPQRSSHEALGHIADVCNIRWAADTQLTLDNDKCISPQWITFNDRLLVMSFSYGFPSCRVVLQEFGSVWFPPVHPSPPVFPATLQKFPKEVFHIAIEERFWVP